MSTVELLPIEVAIAHCWSVDAGILPRPAISHLPPTDDQALLAKVIAGETTFTVADLQRLRKWGIGQPETDLYTKLGDHLDALALSQ